MVLRHQSSSTCIINLGGDIHPWSATKGGKPISATIPEDQKQQETTNQLLITATIPVERWKHNFVETAVIIRYKKQTI